MIAGIDKKAMMSKNNTESCFALLENFNFFLQIQTRQAKPINQINTRPKSSKRHPKTAVFFIAPENPTLWKKIAQGESS